MKVKTSELTRAALDWAVEKAMGKKETDFGWWWDNFHPSSDWSQGGPLIEREEIETRTAHNGGWMANRARTKHIFIDGPTPLVAAMRCFVSSKLGEEVDIPEELL